jgi:hypothetical protein
MQRRLPRQAGPGARLGMLRRGAPPPRPAPRRVQRGRRRRRPRPPAGRRRRAPPPTAVRARAPLNGPLGYGDPKTDGRYIHWDHEILPHWDAKQRANFPTGQRWFLRAGRAGAAAEGGGRAGGGIRGGGGGGGGLGRERRGAAAAAAARRGAAPSGRLADHPLARPPLGGSCAPFSRNRGRGRALSSTPSPLPPPCRPAPRAPQAESSIRRTRCTVHTTRS